MYKNPFYNSPENEVKKEEIKRKCPYCGQKNPYLAIACETCFAYIYPEEEEAKKLEIPEDNRKYNPLAMLSLILGIAGLVIFICYPLGILDSIGAIITGYMARKTIAQNTEKQKGDTLALWGIICGGMALIGSIILAVVDAIWKITSLYS